MSQPIDYLATARSYGFRIQTQAEFAAAIDRPPGLAERAAAYSGTHILWDPDGHCDEFMLVGDGDEALAKIWFEDAFAAYPEDHQIVTYVS